MNTGTAKYVINVVTRDQVGIIANVSDALFRLGGNLEPSARRSSGDGSP